MRWSKWCDRCLFCLLLCEELSIEFEELCSGGADASEKGMIKTAQSRMFTTYQPTVDDWRANECWDEEFMGYRVEEVYDVRNDTEFTAAHGISMEQAGFAPNFSLRGTPRGGSEDVMISKAEIPRRLIACWQAGFKLRQPQVRWLLAPQQAQRKFNDLTAKEVRARGMNIEKLRHWKTTAQINEIASMKAEGIANGEAEVPEKTAEELNNPHFVEEEARWARPQAAAVKSRPSPSKLSSKASECLAAATSPAAKAKKPFKPWSGASPKKKKAQPSPSVVKLEGSAVSSELGSDTAASAVTKVPSVSEQRPWLVRGQDTHLQFEESDSKTYGGDGKRHFYKLKCILSHSCIGTDVNKARNIQS